MLFMLAIFVNVFSLSHQAFAATIIDTDIDVNTSVDNPEIQIAIREIVSELIK